MIDLEDRVITRHDNAPPLEERIIIDFDAGLTDRDGLLARINAIGTKGAALGECKSDDDAGRFGDFIKMCVAAIRVVDEEREIHNRPLLTAQRALKARADKLVEDVKMAGGKAKVIQDAYLADRAAKIDDDRRRIAEIERQAQAARQKIIDDENARLAAIAEAERVRLQEIADAEAAKEAARLQAIEDARAMAEKREAAAVVVEAVKIEAPVAFRYEPAPVFVPSAAPTRAIKGDYGTTVSTVTVWHAEVENMRQLPDHILKHPSVVEAANKLIQGQVRAKNGIRELKGARIWSTVAGSNR